MSGLAGNDFYFADSASDVVNEAAGGGTDRVYASASYTLAAGTLVETLSTNDSNSTAAINLTGNALANVIGGNAGNNLLDGGGGTDTLQGLGGNNSYIVDSAADKIVETTGTDNVNASVTYALAGGVAVETLRTVNAAATTAINLTGNNLANFVTGNAGNNQINGGLGNDTLRGNAGADLFFFNTALNAATNVDTIADYVVANDTVRLENAIFTGLVAGTLNADAFHIGPAAADAEDRIVYNSATGALSYDSNGTGAGGMIQFAKVAPGLAMTNAEFFVV